MSDDANLIVARDDLPDVEQVERCVDDDHAVARSGVLVAATRSSHVLGAFGHDDPRVLSIFVYGEDGRGKRRIGERSNGDRGELRSALEPVVDRRAAVRTEVEVDAIAFIANAKVVGGPSFDGDLRRLEAGLGTKDASRALLAGEAVAHRNANGITFAGDDELTTAARSATDVHAAHSRISGGSRHGSGFVTAPRGALFRGLASAVAACLLAALAPGSIAVRLVKLVPLVLLCAARLRERQGRLAGLVGLGLFASLLADAPIDSVFVAGLGAFLVTHLFYLAGMGLPKRAAGAGLPMLPALVFGGFMWWILVGSGRAPEALHVPITAYALAISSMLGRAIGRAFVEPKDHASRVLCAGALFFVISDSHIGVNRWVCPVPSGGSGFFLRTTWDNT